MTFLIRSAACHSVLVHQVARALVVQTKIRHLQTLRALDERMAKLMEDHLRETVVGVERARLPDRHDSLPIRAGIGIRGAPDTEADALGDGQPNRVEGV